MSNRAQVRDRRDLGSGIDRAMIGRTARGRSASSPATGTRPTLRLAGADLSLRLRKSRGRWEQTVTAAGSSARRSVSRGNSATARLPRLRTSGRSRAICGCMPAPAPAIFSGPRSRRKPERRSARELVHTTRAPAAIPGRRALRGSEIEVAFDRRGGVEAGGGDCCRCARVEKPSSSTAMPSAPEFSARQSIDAHALCGAARVRRRAAACSRAARATPRRPSSRGALGFAPTPQAAKIFPRRLPELHSTRCWPKAPATSRRVASTMRSCISCESACVE